MDELHFTRLKLMARSPAHYAAYQDLTEPTAAMRLGTAVHALALGGDLIRYDGERKGNAWQSFKALVDGADHYVFDAPHRGNAWKAAKEEAAGRVIVTSADVELAEHAAEVQRRRRAEGRYKAAIVTTAEYDQAQRCAEVVRADRIGAQLLQGDTEVPLRWSVLDRPCAGQLDVCGESGVTDLKTTTKSEPGWFERHALGMVYHAQLAWYAEGARQNQRPAEELHIVAVEIKPPFAVTGFRLTDRAVEEGEKMIRLWMERLAGCEAADEWPAYVQSIVPLDVERFELTFEEVA
ncbi:MAG: PD-(D/E)XK nuclease-like domain-containing protein [Myxococcota bacterium]